MTVHCDKLSSFKQFLLFTNKLIFANKNLIFSDSIKIVNSNILTIPQSRFGMFLSEFKERKLIMLFNVTVIWLRNLKKL